MKPKKNHIIVKAYLEQKETHQVHCEDGSMIQLYIGRKYGENSREINPVVCEVLSKDDTVDQLEVGDLIIVHHNMLTNEALRIEKNVPEQSVILTLHASNMLYAKIDKTTGDLTPLYGNCIAERIKSSASELAIFESTEEMKFKIVSTPKDFTDVASGDLVLCYKLSDYEMVYNFKGSERRAIKISSTDILGIFN